MASRAVKGRYHVKKKTGKAIVLSVLAVILAVIAAFSFGAIALANSWLEDLPDYSETDKFATSSTSVVYASDGETVLAEFQLENREPVELDQVSQYVKDATVATEDERFYEHNGVDLMGTVRAMVNNLMGRSREGGSSITQQLVRNTVLSEEMQEISFKRKIREMALATKVEEMYDKDDILLMYLNTINYGSGSYGIQAAAERYYSKDAADLTLSEAATLVGIPQSPTYNNPIDHIENCTARRNTVLSRMESNGYITAEEAQAAKDEPITLNPTENSLTGITAYPYFTSYVRNQLMNQNGKYAFSTADLFEGGLKIVTTLDVNDQQAAEAAAAEKEEEVGEPFEVAMCAIDPDNGYIKAMVGGHDYDNQQVNMATGEGGSGRQVGSTFKAFTYVAALEAGIDPETLIDAGYSVKLDGANEVFNVNKMNFGTRPIESALAVSSNTAFMRLIMSVGVENVRDVAQRMGITSNIQNVAGITLGIDSLTPLEMADAYATLANGGIHYDPECIISVTDASGRVIVDNSAPEGERVLSPEIACAAVEGLQGVVENGTGKEALIDSAQPMAGKTGTTDDKKDSWFVGITPQLSVAIWLGERAPSYDQASRIPSWASAASTFAYFMNRVMEWTDIEQFPTADKPKYLADYRDSKNHIGGKGSGSYDNVDIDATGTVTGGVPNAGGTEGSGETPGIGTTPGTSSGTTGGNEGGSGEGGSGSESGGDSGGTDPAPPPATPDPAPASQ
ncbi:MAG: penicillin-binding protein [Eggerthellaceae bacterium]|nr:penicillin-binding protein [Eggerthellaceae bacterium]